MSQNTTSNNTSNKWIPSSLPGSETRHLYGSVYILEYLGKKSFVSKWGNRAIAISVNDLTVEELLAIAEEKRKYNV
jgi:hypothetical protein